MKRELLALATGVAIWPLDSRAPEPGVRRKLSMIG
jgi:hypothetical protein